MAKTTRDAIEILDELTGDDPELREMIAEEAKRAQVERMIYETIMGKSEQGRILGNNAFSPARGDRH